MARKKNDRGSVSPSRPAPVSPSRPAPISPPRPAMPSPSRPVGPSPSERLASERAQREIYSRMAERDRREEIREGVLSRTPANLAKPAAETIANIDAAKKEARRKELRRGLVNKSRDNLRGALTETTKPERSPLRSADRLRAIKCKSKPKPKKSRPRKSGGGGKRFIPWC